MINPFKIKQLWNIWKNQWLLLLLLLCLCSCTEKSIQNYYLIIGDQATTIERNTINDLKIDLEKVLEGQIRFISENEQLPSKGVFFILGTLSSNKMITNLDKDSQIELSISDPGPRGGIWSKVDFINGQEGIVLAGSDVQGLQYAIYDYSKEVLGIDPLEYWTGKLPEQKTRTDLFTFENRKIAPPKVPLLCYFENDVDELANYRGKLLEYDWESYTEMINSLVRLRYSAIQLFDMLGRPEFFIRPEYKELHPDYQIDVDYLEKMIDFAQSKGMKVAVDFALGYQIHPMSGDKASCWSEYKEDWINSWRYYMEETPLKKTDIFMLRPRHQVWDWEYKSTCGEDKIEVFNEVYRVFGALVDEYKPQADKVLVCYSDGMQAWNDGFRPPKDWIVCWSDDGFGDFKLLPKTTDGYDFGTYMHAGFWLNHTVHNPYPEKIASVMKKAFADLNADKFCLVNGQNFRPFLLNIEAYAEVSNNPIKFNGEEFYAKWTARYFDENTSKYAEESMKLLNKAQQGRIGYVQHLWEIREAISYLSDAPIERPGKTPVPSEYRRVQNDFEHIESTAEFIEASVIEAKKGLSTSTLNQGFYHDYVYLPALLYADLISFEQTLHRMVKLKKNAIDTNDLNFISEALTLMPLANEQLQKIYQNRKTGDQNEKWVNWYNPEIRRPNNGFPNFIMLETVASNLKSKL
ncbi:MAG: glycosyl hydrolase 115 family protein [Maribacter sp.]